MGEPRGGHQHDDVRELLKGALSNLGAVAFFVIVMGALLYTSASDEVRIGRSRNPEFLAGFVVEADVDRDVRRLAALKLFATLEERPRAREAVEARLVAARDSATDALFQSLLRQNLSFLNHDALVAHERELRDRVTAIVADGVDGFPEVAGFPTLREPSTVDVLVDVRTKDDELRFSRRFEERNIDADYSGSAFFGLTPAEMDRLAARARTAALVHRTDAIVGTVAGACQGDALREYADIFVVSLAEARVLAATTVRGLSPAVGTFQTAQVGDCDISGGAAPVGELVALAGR